MTSQGFTLWFTGLSGSGKSTLASYLMPILKERGKNVEILDGVFTELFDTVPKNTYVVVTSDHGELFGEAGYFGHGPIQHDKCFEVPYLEGKIR